MLWKNYFATVQEQLRFNGRGTHATSIQEPADPNSILARSRHLTEFFHSIGDYQ
jgi:hypothetical protein